MGLLAWQTQAVCAHILVWRGEGLPPCCLGNNPHTDQGGLQPFTWSLGAVVPVLSQRLRGEHDELYSAVFTHQGKHLLTSGLSLQSHCDWAQEHCAGFCPKLWRCFCLTLFYDSMIMSVLCPQLTAWQRNLTVYKPL